MTDIQVLLDEYGASHQHPANKKIHWVCVPLIVWSLIAIIWSIQVPELIAGRVGYFNWALLMIVVSIVYYFLVSPSLAIGILAVFLLMLGIIEVMSLAGVPVWRSAVGVFVLAWVGQFVGHHIEGRRPSFFKDLQFLLIGPLWLLSFAYRKVGIPY